MALISDLVAAVARAEGLPVPTVGLVARYAREAGFLSQGARGKNAPHGTAADAANLLIGVNAGGSAISTADVLRGFHALQRQGGSIVDPHGKMHSHPAGDLMKAALSSAQFPAALALLVEHSSIIEAGLQHYAEIEDGLSASLTISFATVPRYGARIELDVGRIVQATTNSPFGAMRTTLLDIESDWIGDWTISGTDAEIIAAVSRSVERRIDHRPLLAVGQCLRATAFT